MSSEIVHALLHTTNIKNVKSILKNGFILSAVDADKQEIKLQYGFTTGGEWKSGDQYPGVYFAPFIKNDVGNKIKYTEYEGLNYKGELIVIKEVQFVFCTDLLKRGDFHYNEYDSNGFISSISHNYNSMIEYFQQKGHVIPDEIVFHNRVPLKPFLKEIWVERNEIKEELLKSLLPEYHNLVKVQSYYPDIIFKCNEHIDKLHPNYCYYLDKYERPYYKKRGYSDNVDVYKKIAYNCGLKKDEISKLDLSTKKGIKKLVEALKPLVNERFLLENNKLTPLDYYEPPFKEKPF